MRSQLLRSYSYLYNKASTKDQEQLCVDMLFLVPTTSTGRAFYMLSGLAYPPLLAGESFFCEKDVPYILKRNKRSTIHSCGKNPDEDKIYIKTPTTATVLRQPLAEPTPPSRSQLCRSKQPTSIHRPPDRRSDTKFESCKRSPLKE